MTYYPELDKVQVIVSGSAVGYGIGLCNLGSGPSARAALWALSRCCKEPIHAKLGEGMKWRCSNCLNLIEEFSHRTSGIEITSPKEELNSKVAGWLGVPENQVHVEVIFP